MIPLEKQVVDMLWDFTTGKYNMEGMNREERLLFQSRKILAIPRIAELLAKLEQAGGDLSRVVVLDDDQSLPEHDIVEPINGWDSENDLSTAYIDGWNECKEDMFNANFRRIKQPEATGEDIDNE